MAEWIKKKQQCPNIYCLQKTHFSFKDTHKLKVEVLKEIFQENGNQKRIGGNYIHVKQNRLEKSNKKQRRLLYDDKEVSLSREHNNWKYISETPWWLSGKESICNTEDMGSTPGLGRFPEEGNGNPLQYSRVDSPMFGRAWWFHGVAKESDTT